MLIRSIADLHGRRSIVVEPTYAPDQAWLDLQAIAPSTDGDWSNCFPLSGGAVVVNENDMEETRPASLREFQQAYKNANGFAREKLLKLLLI